MNDEIAQLLASLHLARIAEILDDEIAKAEKKQASYQGPPRGAPARPVAPPRRKTALAYRIRRSGLPEQWSLESFPWKRQPGVSQRQIPRLRRARLHRQGREHRLRRAYRRGEDRARPRASSSKALQNGHRGIFVRAQDLFDEMYASLADRSSRKLVDRLARVDLLVVDEMGYLNLRPEQTNIFFKLMGGAVPEEVDHHHHQPSTTTSGTTSSATRGLSPRFSVAFAISATP